MNPARQAAQRFKRLFSFHPQHDDERDARLFRLVCWAVLGAAAALAAFAWWLS